MVEIFCKVREPWRRNRFGQASGEKKKFKILVLNTTRNPSKEIKKKEKKGSGYTISELRGDVEKA